MVVQVRVTSNADEIAKKIKAKYDKLEKGARQSVRETAEFAKQYMFSIAPFDTGKTARAIKWTKGRTQASATVIIGDGHPERRGLIDNQYGLTYYMNFVAKDLTHWKTGEPRFIQKGVAEAQRRFGRKVRRVINAFVK